MRLFSDMNKVLSFLACLLLLQVSLSAQNAPYADASNPFYWKNRKPFQGYWQQDVNYKIKAQLNDSSDIVTGEEVLTYTNNSPDTLHFVYFHLYQNAFSKGSYLEKLNRANKFYQKFGRYEKDGDGTRIQKMEVNIGGITYAQRFMSPSESYGLINNPELKNIYPDRREDLAYYIDSPGVAPFITDFVKFDNTIMRVKLPAPLLPGQQAEFKIDFKTFFDDGGNQRRRMKMFKDAWGNKQYDGVHWYPRICVYDRKFGWETDQHLGKEFYGDFGSYDVELTLPNHYILDATGVLQNTDEVLPQELRSRLDVSNFKDKPLESKPSVIVEPNGTYKTWKFKSINTHDFAWVADPTFRIGEVVLTLKSGKKVSCISLSQEPHSARWQDAATFNSKVIEVYSRDIGEYAYPKMIVADARDGMEYPMLTLDGGLSPGYYGLFAHEVGHNWFFGMVGNNETYRASLDEGFTQFLTNWCMTSIFGEVKPTRKNPYPLSRRDQTVYMGYLRDAMKHQDMPLNTHSDDFNGALHHGGGYGHVYYKTATMLYNLQYVLGDTLFLAAMQHYFDQWKMAHPYFEDFRSSIIQFTHVDLNWFFDQWMETTKTIDYAVLGYHKEGYNVRKLPVAKVSEAGFNVNRWFTIDFLRRGDMQMPIDFTIYGKDSGQVFSYIIPNTYFVKSHDTNTTVLPAWKGWSILNKTYQADVYLPLHVKIDRIEIDPSHRLADVYHLDNSTGSRSIFVLDRGRKRPADRYRYVFEWRPDIWYNSVDQVKAGLHLEGNYMNYHDIFKASIWYNTDRFNRAAGSGRNTIDYTFEFKVPSFVSNKVSTMIELRQLDGLTYVKTGVEIDAGRGLTYAVYFKGLGRRGVYAVDYLLYNQLWNADKGNNTLNVDLTKAYTYRNGNGEFSEGLRASFASDYDYSSVFMQWINHHRFWGMELHSRLMWKVITGDNIAPESQLYLSGANPEEMMDNKYVRSRAFVPVSWLGYGADYNHFQFGGGLNIRGYAGYLVPRQVENIQVYMFGGNTGASSNLELDLDGLVSFKPRSISSYLHLDAYLFGDAGFLQNTFNATDFGLTADRIVSTDLMASAGAGFALTIKKWMQWDKAKPLTLRFDMPLFLSHTPFVDGQNFRFRWQVGVNRNF